MASTNRFKVKQKGGEWLIFDTLSAAKRYIGVATLVKLANQLQKMALRWEDKLKVTTEENATLKAQLATLQEAHANTVSHMSQEVARLQEELDEWNEMAVTPKHHMDALDARDKEIARVQSDFGQRLVDQAADYEAKIVDLNKSLAFWRGEGMLKAQEGDIF